MKYLAEKPRAYEFRYGTTHRTEDGFEFAIIAKSREELNRAWQMIAGPARFDEGKVSEVQIRRA